MREVRFVLEQPEEQRLVQLALQFAHGLEVAALGQAFAVEPADCIAANVATQLVLAAAADAGGGQGVVRCHFRQLPVQVVTQLGIEKAFANVPTLFHQGVDQTGQGAGRVGRSGEQRHERGRTSGAVRAGASRSSSCAAGARENSTVGRAAVHRTG